LSNPGDKYFGRNSLCFVVATIAEGNTMEDQGQSREYLASELHLQDADIESLKAKRQNSENEILTSPEMQSTLLENPIVAVGLSDGNRVLYANRLLLDLFGYTDLNEFLSIPLLDHVAPSSRTTIMERLRGSDSGIRFDPTFVYDIKRKDGSVRTLEINVAPYEWKGRTCRLSLFRDITERIRTEEALRESEAKYRALIETTGTGYVILDQEGKVLSANQEYVRLAGFGKLQEIVGRNVIEWTAQHEIERNREEIKKCLERGSVRNLELDYVNADGKLTPIEINATVLKTAEGSRIVTLCRDISARKRSLETVRSSEERFRLIAETIDEVFWISDIEGEKAEYISPAYDRIWGYRREVLYENAKRFVDNIHPDDCELVKATLALKKTGQPYAHEYRIVRSDGSVRNIRDCAYPISDENRQIKRYVGVAQDVTEMKRTEEALRESTEYLNDIINCIGDPIFVKDRRHAFVLVNDAFCLQVGKAREDLLGKTAQELLPKQQADLLTEQENAVFVTGMECITEDEVDAQGGIRTNMTRRTKLKDKAGNEQIVGVIRDITERKRLEAQLLQSQKMEAIGVLAGGVAHDFNNLLNVINGYSELLLDDLSPDHPGYEDLERIRQAGQRAAALTSQLLAFSRKQILQPRTIDLNEVVSDTCKILRRIIGENIDLAVVAQPGLWFIKADPAQIQQVIMNLAINARDAMTHGGKLTIETANVLVDADKIRDYPGISSGPHVVLVVSDNGVGMDRETQAHIFEPFFTTKRPGKGTGLGLSTVYGIIKQSNGFIGFTSGQGKGTAFTIHFPKSQSEPDNYGGTVKAEIKLPANETVLLVEDEAAVRGLAARILQDQGYRVIEASSGKEALDIVREFSGTIHLILTDVIMPGMSGPDLVSRITPEHNSTRVLYMTGYANEDIVQHGVLNQGIALLQKPFTPASLAGKVRQVLDLPQ
jgi:two-component system, cell cycle sensor histidine kinase and response regulator CckA